MDRYQKAKMSQIQQNVMSHRYFRLILGALGLIFVTFLVFGGSSGSPSTRSSGAIAPVDEAGKPVNPDLICSKSFDGKRPVTQYVVMVDAGSSGSRVHVYKFNNCKEMPVLLDEAFKMIEPGLSGAYKSSKNVESTAASLDELMNFAVENVPEESRRCAPVAVKATAGLRLLGEEDSNRILEAVRTRLETKYPFPVVAEDGVALMDGKDEGVFAWITANYLLGNIGTKKKTPSAAVFDLGGGSTQIVFEPEFELPDSHMEEGDHKYELSFGSRDFELYQHSHLGYGLNEARKKINGLVYSAQKDVASSTPMINPCLPPGTNATVKAEVVDPVDKTAKPKTVEVQMQGPAENSDSQCRALAEQILNKDTECSRPPCSFNGIHQPSLVDSFPASSDIYIFSFFYDRTYPLGMPSSFSVQELKDLAHKVCAGESAYPSFTGITGAVKELKENPEYCLDLSFMTAILHTGYDIPAHRELRIAKKIDNRELGWCLGASLPLLDAVHWKCKA